MSKINALAMFLECEIDDISESTDRIFEDGGDTYLVLTDDEADDEAKESILESVWAFLPDFLACHAKDGIDADVFRAIQDNGKCEDNNKAILALLDDVDHFVDDAIRADGRGHFLSSYDGEEDEVTLDGITYYICKM